MIEIRIDKESEFIWLQNVINAGVLNSCQGYTMKFLGIPLNQNVTFIKSDNYEDDIKEKREEFNRRFADKGLRGMDVERILKEEYKKEHQMIVEPKYDGASRLINKEFLNKQK